MKKEFFLIVIFILLMDTTMSSQDFKSTAALLPDSLNGWTHNNSDKTFVGDELFDHINGGAELYMSYGYKHVLSRSYTQQNQPEILVDIFKMNTAYDAFGVFTHARETNEKRFGQGSQTSTGAILFWKDDYYISILAYPETDESKQTTNELAKYIEVKIDIEGELPDVVSLLPKEHLLTESVKYFRHYIWLNTYYFISHENILNISQDTHAILARYNYEDDKPILTMIEYPSNEKAEQGYDKFVNSFLPEYTGNPVKIEDGTYTDIRRINNYIIIVLKCKTEKAVTSLLDQASQNLN